MDLEGCSGIIDYSETVCLYQADYTVKKKVEKT